MIVDRALRAETNRIAHLFGQRAAQAARQALADRLQALRHAGADRAALTAFLQACEAAGEVVDGIEFKA